MVKLCEDRTARARYAMQRMTMAQERMLQTMNCPEAWERAYKWAAAWGVAARMARTCSHARACSHRTHCTLQPTGRKPDE